MLKMVIFHCYVSLPESMPIFSCWFGFYTLLVSLIDIFHCDSDSPPTFFLEHRMMILLDDKVGAHYLH